MLRILSRMPNRGVYKITKSPTDKNSNSRIKIKEITIEIKPLNECENAMIVFDNHLGSTSSRDIDQFFL